MIDAVLAAIVTVLLIVLAPGWAVVGLVAIVLLLVCGVSLAIDRIRGRAARRPAPPRWRGTR
jgi:hypothetical protein